MGCCDDFTRSQFLRQGVAQAGQGLPEIEFGMPTPAGTGLTRRSMLLGSAGMALTVYGAEKLGFQAFEEGIAEAASGPANAVIVTIFMAGGLDGMSVLAPITDAYYQSKRTTLKLDDQTTLPVTGSNGALGWHQKAAAMKALHDAGKATLFPAISYDHPNQSHFTSRHFWEVGALDPAGSTGWLGRWLDVVGSDNNPIQGLSLGSQLSPALASTRVAVSAADPGGYDFPSPGVNSYDKTDPVTQALASGFAAVGAPNGSDPVLVQARQAQRNAAGLRDQFDTPLLGLPAGVTYPAGNYLASKLKNLGQMLQSNLPIRACTLDANGGFDTHTDEFGSMPANLESNCLAIAAFQAHLEAAGLADRVITLVWSEFGRRPEENSSGGTDHGAAGVGFLVGSKASGNIIGEFPNMATNGLDAYGNVVPTSDFRALYCALLDGWLATDPGLVIPGADTFELAPYTILKP
jgi:uncharacterized protein (DUF1501 family)